jgi:hypothetical protein
LAGALHSDEEYLAAVEARHHEAKEQYRIYRLRRLVKAGYSLKLANQLELAGVACHDAERLIAEGCDPETAAEILKPLR